MDAEPKLLAVDLDGTLVTRDGTVQQVDRLAISRLRDAGIVVTIATGRTPAATLHVARDLGLEGPCVCTDGALIIDMESGEELAHRSVGRKATGAIATALERFPNVMATVLVGSTAVIETSGNMLERVARAWSPTVEEVPTLLQHPAWQSEVGITAGAVIGLTKEVEEIARALDEEPVAVVHFDIKRQPGLSSLILHGDDVNKASGVAELAARHGLTIDNAVTVGDWLNDLSMLKAAPRSFAMAHAPEEVQAAAKSVLAASRAGGAIAEIAERVWDIR